MATININIPDELAKSIVHVLDKLAGSDTVGGVVQAVSPSSSSSSSSSASYSSSAPPSEPPQYLEFKLLGVSIIDKFNVRLQGPDPYVVLFKQCTNGYAPAMALPMQRYCGAYYYTKENFSIHNGVGDRYTTLNGDTYTCAIISDKKIILSLVKGE